MKNSVYSIVPFAWTLKNNMCMFVCYHLCVCVGGEIHICLYKHRLSLEGNTRKLFALAPRLARWAAGEQVHYILIWIFEFLYYVQVVLTKTFFFFFNIKKLRRENHQGGPWLLPAIGLQGQRGACALVCSTPCCSQARSARCVCGLTRQEILWGNAGASLKKDREERIADDVGVVGGLERTGCVPCGIWSGSGNRQSWIWVLTLPSLAVCPWTHDPFNKSQFLPHKLG